MGKKKSKRRKNEEASTQRRREFVQSSPATIRADLDQPSQAAWGTSPGAMGRVKAESEEARLDTCPACGYSGGRHSRFCEAS